GIAGLGRIGKAVAERGKVFGMKLIAYEPFPDKVFAARLGLEFVSFDQLLANADYLSLHLPLTEESRHLINKQTLARMKPSAFLINTARGGLVCEADLVEALGAGRIGGAGLDVFEEEPPIKPSPVCQFENVVVTPHAAGVDLQSRDDMAVSAARTIAALSPGEWPGEGNLNPEVRSRFRRWLPRREAGRKLPKKRGCRC